MPGVGEILPLEDFKAEALLVGLFLGGLPRQTAGLYIPGQEICLRTVGLVGPSSLTRLDTASDPNRQRPHRLGRLR